MKDKFVLFMESADNGCNWYRIRQPYLKLLDTELFPCASNRDLNELDMDTWITNSNVVVSQAATAPKFLQYMIEQQGKKKFIIDLDDNLFSVDAFNPAYRDIGVEEVKTNQNGSSIYLWKDGEKGFNLKVNRARMQTAVETLKLCDMITTPSSVLSGFLKQFNKNVRVIKNFVDLNSFYPIKMQKDDFIRIGWQGGESHYRDFYMIKDAIKEIMERNKNVILVIMGTHFKGLTAGLPQDRVETHGWLNVRIYPWKFKTLNIDIGLAPIENTEFNTCKSEIKWEEYGAIGIPCVASNIPPYLLAINHKKTGFLADGKDEWIEYIDLLIKNRDLRISVGEAAKKEVIENYDLEKRIDDYYYEYNTLFQTKLIVA